MQYRYILAAVLILFCAPASATMWKWSQTAATNSTVDATINWAEGQAPSSVNNSARALMAAVAKFRDDLAGVAPSNAIIETSGTGTAYAVSSSQSLSSLTNGFTITFRVASGDTNTGAVTLAVDGLTAKGIVGVVGTDLSAGELVEGSMYTVTYMLTADKWVLHNYRPGVPVGTVTAFTGTTAPTGYLLMYGQCVSTTTYAALYAAQGSTDVYDESSACGGGEFAIADMRGRVPAGQDDAGGVSANRLVDGTDSLNGDTLGDVGGVETQTIAEAELPSHHHTGPSHQHGAGSYSVSTTITNGTLVSRGTSINDTSDEGSNSFTLQGASLATLSLASGTVSGTSTAGGTEVTGNTGSGTAIAITQPTIILNYIVKY